MASTIHTIVKGVATSKLSIKWMRLRITHERIEPGKPTQNDRHERLHRTLKEDTATPSRESPITVPAIRALYEIVQWTAVIRLSEC